jgi:TolA-binding protein
MKNWNLLFISFCFTLIIGLLQAYNLFKNHFSPVNDLKAQIHLERKKVEAQKMLTKLAEFRLQDIKYEVSKALPAEAGGSQGLSLQLRSLASVSSEATSIDLSGALLERAKSEFRRGNFRSSLKVLKEIQNKYPDSVLMSQVFFFQAENLFLLGEYVECLEVIDQMIVQFPQSELTGFIMLRMAQVMQSRNQNEEAAEVYSLILAQFKGSKDLQQQTEKLLALLEL